MRKNILVLFGGKSTEYEVSLCSAASVLRNISHEIYSVYALGITKDGQWLLSDGDPDAIEANTWQNRETHRAWISPNYGEGLYIQTVLNCTTSPSPLFFLFSMARTAKTEPFRGFWKSPGCLMSDLLHWQPL